MKENKIEKNKTNRKDLLIKISFILYIVLLTWIIVFKFRLNINDLKYIRTINLIPFKANNIVNGLKETIINLILFIPSGMYLKYIFKDKKLRNILIIIGTSLIYEITQYILHVGVSDITDIIMNTLGGLVGILLVSIIVLLDKKLNKNIFTNLLKILLILLPIIMLLGLFII